jgi:hypothetical protein
MFAQVGFFVEGPVDRIRGATVSARKNKFCSADLRKSDPMWILARGSGVCVIMLSWSDAPASVFD